MLTSPELPPNQSRHSVYGFLPWQIANSTTTRTAIERQRLSLSSDRITLICATFPRERTANMPRQYDGSACDETGQGLGDNAVQAWSPSQLSTVSFWTPARLARWATVRDAPFRACRPRLRHLACGRLRPVVAADGGPAANLGVVSGRSILAPYGWRLLSFNSVARLAQQFHLEGPHHRWVGDDLDLGDCVTDDAEGEHRTGAPAGSPNRSGSTVDERHLCGCGPPR